MDIDRELREAIDAELASIPARSVAPLVADLSNRYRSNVGEGQRFIQTKETAMAYAAYRMPATLAAVRSCLGEIKERLPRFSPLSLLDVGAGPGTSLWAARSVFSSLVRASLLEREETMISLGKALAARSEDEVIRQACWIKADAATSFEASAHDLVVASYTLNEMPESAALALSARLWDLTSDVLLIVEPGTPAGFSRVRRYREQLIAGGAAVVAPCPHQTACPMKDDDWCHFSRRVERSRLHRGAKAGELAYEDEKFSYIAFSRTPVTGISGRILRHPQVRPGHIKFEVCEPDGLKSIVVTRSDRERFKQARDSHWGSVMPE
jgi:ribosomal protein RSM22 (predicted rRNA methylase)